MKPHRNQVIKPLVAAGARLDVKIKMDDIAGGTSGKDKVEKALAQFAEKRAARAHTLDEAVRACANCKSRAEDSAVLCAECGCQLPPLVPTIHPSALAQLASFLKA